MTKKEIIKNVLIGIFVPSVVAGVYFGYKFVNSKIKIKKILDVLSKHFDEGKKLDGMKEQVISHWKKDLASLSSDELSAFFDYFMVTIPNGKITILDDKKEKKSVWIYEKDNKLKFDIISGKALKAINGKDIEKLFNALSSEI